MSLEHTSNSPTRLRREPPREGAYIRLEPKRTDHVATSRSLSPQADRPRRDKSLAKSASGLVVAPTLIPRRLRLSL